MGSKVISVLTTLVLGTMFSEELLGSYGLFLSYVTIIAAFLGGGAEAIVGKYVVSSKNYQKESLRILNTVTLLNCLIFSIIIVLLSLTINDKVDIYFVLLSIATANCLLWSKYIIRMVKFTEDIKSVPTVILARSFMILCAIYLSALIKLEIILIGALIALVYLITFIFISQQIKIKFYFKIKSSIFREVSYEFYSYSLNRVLGFSVVPLQNILLFNMSGPSISGVYFLVVSIGSVFTIFLQSVSDNVQSWIYRNSKVDQKTDAPVAKVTSKVKFSCFIVTMLSVNSVSLFNPLLNETFLKTVYYLPLFLCFALANFYKNLYLHDFILNNKNGIKTALVTFYFLTSFFAFSFIFGTDDPLIGVFFWLAFTRYISAKCFLFWIKNASSNTSFFRIEDIYVTLCLINSLIIL
jgi:O-antigen/teichoic acid export membrane protein